MVPRDRLQWKGKLKRSDGLLMSVCIALHLMVVMNGDYGYDIVKLALICLGSGRRLVIKLKFKRKGWSWSSQQAGGIICGFGAGKYMESRFPDCQIKMTEEVAASYLMESIATARSYCLGMSPPGVWSWVIPYLPLRYMYLYAYSFRPSFSWVYM